MDIWKSRWVTIQCEEDTVILHSDSYWDPHPLLLSVHFILDISSLSTSYIASCTTGKVYVMSCTELFVSELWKEGKLEPYKLFLKENVLFQERIQCIRVECKKSTEFRLPNYCAPKENLKYYLENRLSMKFMYLQIPTLYLVSSDILPHT